MCLGYGIFCRQWKSVCLSYPHQWSWDSGFIAIGNSYYHIEWAIEEIEFLFGAQWRTR
jgi:hypothetical protein